MRKRYVHTYTFFIDCLLPIITLCSNEGKESDAIEVSVMVQTHIKFCSYSSLRFSASFLVKGPFRSS